MLMIMTITMTIDDNDNDNNDDDDDDGVYVRSAGDIPNANCSADDAGANVCQDWNVGSNSHDANPNCSR